MIKFLTRENIGLTADILSLLLFFLPDIVTSSIFRLILILTLFLFAFLLNKFNSTPKSPLRKATYWLVIILSTAGVALILPLLCIRATSERPDAEGEVDHSENPPWTIMLNDKDTVATETYQSNKLQKSDFTKIVFTINSDQSKMIQRIYISQTPDDDRYGTLVKSSADQTGFTIAKTENGETAKANVTIKFHTKPSVDNIAIKTSVIYYTRTDWWRIKTWIFKNFP